MQRLACLLILFVGFFPSSRGASYVIGGEESAQGKWPWHLALYRWNFDFWMYRCGASLIHPKYAMTAAHCVDWSGRFLVEGGGFNLTANDYEQAIESETTHIHPDYDMLVPGIPGDIAILELQEEFVLSENIQIVSLPEDGEDFVGNPECWIHGWGITDSSIPPEEKIYPNDVLMEANVHVLTFEECTDWWAEISDFNEVYESHICHGVYDVQEVASCSGDSGSAMSCYLDSEGAWVTAGITSWGSAICEEAPSVHTRVTSYLDWIKSIVPIGDAYKK